MQWLTRRLCRSRLGCAVALSCFALLALPAIASASWGWTGYLPSGNGSCWFYTNSSSCSTTANWFENQISVTAQPLSPPYYQAALGGFETPSAVRGEYLNPGSSDTLYHSAWFTDTNVAGQMSCVPSGCSWTRVWFQVS